MIRSASPFTSIIDVMIVIIIIEIYDRIVDIYTKSSSSLFFFFYRTFLLSSLWTSRGHRCRPFSPPGSCLQFLPRIGFSNPTARRFFNRMMLTHAVALSACQFVHKKKSQRIYTSMHSAGLELTKLTYTRLEDNLIRHRGDRSTTYFQVSGLSHPTHHPTDRRLRP